MRVVKVSRSADDKQLSTLPYPHLSKGRPTAQNATIKLRSEKAKAAKFSGTAPAHRPLRLFIYEISPLAYANSVCGFPKGTLRKVASLRSSREMTLGGGERSVVRSQILQR